MIPRGLFGIEPIEPGFKKFRIKPQTSNLRYAKLKTPTIRGDIKVCICNEPTKSYKMELNIPANSEAEVWIPVISEKYNIDINGKQVKGKRVRNFEIINIGSGEHKICISDIGNPQN